MSATTTHIFRAFTPEIRDDVDLPAGVIGQVAGIALIYDEIDSFNSTFARGALERTIRERVAAGKVKLFWDHGDSPKDGMYDSDLHIGTVRSLTDIQLDDGRWAAYMVADLLDTPKAREVKQYLASVLASGGETGLSIGCVGRLMKGIKSEMGTIKGEKVERITEFPLSEISITSMQSVPDSEVLAVRTDIVVDGDPAAVAAAVVDALREDDPILAPVIRTTQQVQEEAFVALLRALPVAVSRAHVRAVLGDAEPEDSDAPVTGDSDAAAQDSPTDPEAPPPVVVASMEARTLALRQSYV